MRYKQYGRTGKNLSVIGFGGTYSGCNTWNADVFEKCVELAVIANEKGINYFDTAHTYANYKGEHILGRALKRMKNEFFISTKSKYDEDPTADALRRRLETSLKTLDVDKIHFFHIWTVMDIEQYRNIKKPGGPLEGALKAKEEGLIEHLCFSTHCTGEEIEEIVNDGYFEGVTIGYNVLNSKYREQGIAAAHEKGLGVAIMNPLGGGFIPQNPNIFSYILEFQEDTVSMAALRFLLNKDEITLALTGASTLEQLDENISVADDGKTLDRRYYERINANFSEKFVSLCTGCRYCQGCPANLEIPKLMMEHDRYLLSNKNAERLYWNLKINWDFRFGEQFPCKECGICEKKCTQHLPIMQKIAEINDANLKLRQFLEHIEPNVGIYGTGAFTNDIVVQYENGLGEIDFAIHLFDSDPQKWGTSFNDRFTIYSPDEILTLGVKKIIVATRTYYKEIYKRWKHLEKDGVEFIFPY